MPTNYRNTDKPLRLVMTLNGAAMRALTSKLTYGMTVPSAVSRCFAVNKNANLPFCRLEI